MATVDSERDRMLRIGEVAARLDLSVSTVRRLIADGRLPAIQVAGPGSAIRVSERELLEWLYG